jgi:hypothetical protein
VWPSLWGGLAGATLLAAAVALAQDRGKKFIERPVEKVVAANTDPAPPPAEPANPKVEPGKVKWHPDFETACKASKQSGKPVFVFHMMGKLDDQFC